MLHFISFAWGCGFSYSNRDKSCYKPATNDVTFTATVNEILEVKCALKNHESSVSGFCWMQIAQIGENLQNGNIIMTFSEPQKQRIGAEEAHWAHNPRVGGSKLPFARFLLFDV